MEPKPSGEDKVGQEITKLKKKKQGKNIQASLINSKSIWEDGEGKERGSRKGEGKEMITINHSKRRQHNNHQYNAFCSVPSKEKETFNLTIEVTSEGI